MRFATRLSFIVLPCALLAAGCALETEPGAEETTSAEQDLVSVKDVDGLVKSSYGQIAKKYHHGKDAMVSVLFTRITNLGNAGDISKDTEIEVSGAAFLEGDAYAEFSGQGTVGEGLSLSELTPVGGGAWLNQAHFAPTVLPHSTFAEALQALRDDGDKITKVFEVTLETRTSDTDRRSWVITYERSTWFGMSHKTETKAVEEETLAISNASRE